MEEKNLGYMDYCNLYQELDKLFFNAVGEEYCKPDHYNGPKIREPYLFHFVVSGEGIFEIQNQRYHIKPNQGFLIPNPSIIYYKADSKNPWHYCWLSLQGEFAQEFFKELKLSESNPIYTAKPDNNIYSTFKELLDRSKAFQNNPYGAISSLFRCMDSLCYYSINSTIQKESQQNQYVKSSKLFMESNYHRSDLKIEDIANHIGINRSYLTRLFSKFHSVCPQQYLINIRMQKAKDLLITTTAPISIIASSVGYEDIFIFSKFFKKRYGTSPKKYRENYIKNK